MKLRSKKIAKFLAALLAIQFAGFIYVTPASAACTGTVINLFDSTKITAFPADFGDGLKSGYVGYEVVGLTNPWIKITSFTGGKLGLATNQPGEIKAVQNSSGRYLAYVYLTASGLTSTPQTINFEVYQGQPSASGTLNCTDSQSFSTGVGDETGADVIKASSNKVTSITSNISGSMIAGDTFTVTVKGDTGTWSNSVAGQKRRIALTPSTNNNWPAEAYQLVNSSFSLDSNEFSMAEKIGFEDPADGNKDGVYTAVYTYLINTVTTSASAIVAPVGYIDSGTQLKHTTTTTGYTTLTVTTATTYSITLNAATGGTSSSSAANVTAGGSVTLTANPSAGYSFTSWNCSGGGTITSNTTNPTDITGINANVTCSPVFTANTTYSVTYNGNTSGSGSVPVDADSPFNSGETTTVLANTGNLIKANYDFDGWCTAQPSAGSTCASAGGTKYSANDTITVTSNVIFYAIWKTTPPSGGGGSPAPVYVPHPPTITSISAAEVCAITPQLVIKGTWLTGATAKVDGVAAQVLATSQNEMTVVLPSAPVGTKTITVTNADGSATTTVKYAFADTPIYVDYIYPETFKDRFFSYIFKALDAVKYEISGTMPAGLTLNSTTGELSGAPTQEGNFVFQIIASNICASTPLIVYMFVDKAIPTAFTCSVAFNVPSSNNITEAKLTNLRNCLSKTSTLSPKYINPVIFISGGLPAGLTSDQALTHPRYLPILDLIVSMNLNAQIYYGAFNGSTDSVQLNVYWPDPS